MFKDVLPYTAALAILAVIFNYLHTALNSDLNRVPGPLLTKFSVLYRWSLVYRGSAPSGYRKLHRRYGPIVRTGPKHISVSDPSEIQNIYGIGSKYTKTEFYSTMAPKYEGTTMDSMFTARDSAYHKHLKGSVSHIFSMTNMRNFETYVDECTDIFVNAIQDMRGEPMDLAIWLQWYAFDVIGGITFQRRFGFLEERKDVDDMIGGIDFGLNYVKFIGQTPGLHKYLLGNQRLLKTLQKLIPGQPKDALSKFMEITENEIKRYDEAEKSGQRKDFLAQLRAKELKEGHMTRRDIVNHLSNNLLAGSDTTAISLRACFYYLIKTPSAYRKLQEEIDEANERGVLSENITFEQSNGLQYLQAVIKEAMRMHPGVAFPLERCVPPEGSTICDKQIPSGTNVSMSAPVLHTDASVFGHDADEFRPERWLDAPPEKLRIMNRSFLAFGYGARTCIGKNISLMEMGKFIPSILRQFDIIWVGERDTWTTNAAWFWKQSDMMVRFEARAAKS